ncbi:MAG TPA: GGDEF domain-containing protein [Cyclobacteriaceae bacterium]|jgi:GGDEF domain-containing protein|nr:GGDEF domain-containing protein [Cyclobacteriaceae bacterium]
MVTYGLIDIDNFTAYNQINGFEKGNDILIEFLKLGQKTLNPKTWGKFGSDEYLFVLNGSFNEHNHSIFELLKRSKEVLNITISIGVSEQVVNVEVKEIINLLRVNLLTAKGHGKNRICVT